MKMLSLSSNAPVYIDIEPLLSSANVGQYSWIIRLLELYNKDLLGMSIFVFMGLIYFVCLILLIIIGYVTRGLGKLKKESNKRSNKRFYYVIDTVILFGLASSIYLLVNFLYTFVLGIIIIKTICFLLIGLASVFIRSYANSRKYIQTF